MENITKALLMAAGMLLAVLILSLLVMAYNKLSGYYEQSQELLTAEQLDKFNKQFQNYAGRKDIRGNELISLMNKIIDYNESESYQVGTNYEPIKVKITIGENLVDAFKYETDDEGHLFITKCGWAQEKKRQHNTRDKTDHKYGI